MARIYLDTLNRRVLDPGVGKTGEPGPPGEPGTPGESGGDGTPGDAATVSVGTVTTLGPGSSATVENVGTSADAILNFGIPQGEQGDPGGGSSSFDFGDEDPNDLTYLEYPLLYIQTTSPHKVWKKNVGVGYTDIT